MHHLPVFQSSSANAQEQIIVFLQKMRTCCFQCIISVVVRWLLSYAFSIHVHIFLCLPFYKSRDWKAKIYFLDLLLVLEIIEILPVRCLVQNLEGRGQYSSSSAKLTCILADESFFKSHTLVLYIQVWSSCDIGMIFCEFLATGSQLQCYNLTVLEHLLSLFVSTLPAFPMIW